MDYIVKITAAEDTLPAPPLNRTTVGPGASFPDCFPRWTRFHGIRPTTFFAAGPGLYDGVNVGQWGKPHWGFFQWGKWDPTAGFPWPSFPEQPSRYVRHYGYGIARSQIGNEYGVAAITAAAVPTSVGRYVGPDVFPEYWRKRYNVVGGAFVPAFSEANLPAVPFPQAEVLHNQRRAYWDWRFQHLDKAQVVVDFGTHVWTEPGQAAISTAWTEPAQSVITTSWTEPGQSPVTSTWTEPAVTPITPSPEVN